MRYAHSLTALAVAVALLSPQSYAQQEPDRTEQQIERIIVLGEKTERSLKDVTSSITVLTQEELDTMRYKSVHEAIAETPNVVALSGALPDIRGVSGNGAAGGFNSITGGAKGRVVTLVDGIAQPFVADLGGDSGIWDMQQIEIYRGPQSTSNGRNSMAGSIYIKTNDPTEQWEAKVRAGYRNQDRYIDTAGVISGPIVEDTLSFRFSAQHVDADTISTPQPYADNPAPFDLDALKTTNLRAKLLWTPNDDLAVKLTHTDNNEQGNSGRTFYKGDPDSTDKHQRFLFRDIETDVSTTSIETDYNFTDALSLEVLVAVMDYRWGYDSYEPVPEAQQQLIFDEKNTTLDAKLNIGQSSDTLKGFIGLAYFERDQDINSTGSDLYTGDDSSKSSALYGEINLALTDRFSITAGARLERESQRRHFVYGPIDAALDKSNTILLPKLVLAYELTAETTIALSARQGYNAAGGALNYTAQQYYYYDEEKVNTFEFSSRSTLAGGDVFINANLFYNEYDGFQALSSTRFIANLDKVSSYGAELAINANVTEQLEVNAALGLLKTNIDSAGSNYPTVEGNKLNSAPSVTTNLGARYWFTDRFHIGAFASYTGEYYGDFENTEGRIAGDYSLLRFTAGYTHDSWIVSAFINNALDETAVLSKDPASRFYPEGYYTIADPRNVGISVSYTFW